MIAFQPYVALNQTAYAPSEHQMEHAPQRMFASRPVLIVFRSLLPAPFFFRICCIALSPLSVIPAIPLPCEPYKTCARKMNTVQFVSKFADVKPTRCQEECACKYLFCWNILSGDRSRSETFMWRIVDEVEI